MKEGGSTERCRVAQSPGKVQYITVNEKMVEQSDVQSVEPDTENEMIQLYTYLAVK